MGQAAKPGNRAEPLQVLNFVELLGLGAEGRRFEPCPRYQFREDFLGFLVGARAAWGPWRAAGVEPMAVGLSGRNQVRRKTTIARPTAGSSACSSTENWLTPSAPLPASACQASIEKEPLAFTRSMSACAV